MNKLIITFALLSVMNTAGAQTLALSTPKAEEKSNFSAIVKPGNEFGNATMNHNGTTLSFDGLPNTDKASWAIITDEYGEIVKQTKITASENTIDVHRLGKGMYFVSLVCKDQCKKAFVLNL